MLKKKTLLIIPIVLIMTFVITMMTPICVYADNATYPQEQISSEVTTTETEEFHFDENK